MASPQMYVRVKRKATTIFLNVEKSDSFSGIKQKIAEIINVDAEKIRLFTSTDMAASETVDTAFVDNFVDSDAILYMTLDSEQISIAEAPMAQ
mmetsp:Transcript_9563/g.28597  ORF Transcript_9563/g.28597 Transcript_9563/m.28597 type:complete len:93 (+) Transcript_9563:227-505(+)